MKYKRNGFAVELYVAYILENQSGENCASQSKLEPIAFLPTVTGVGNQLPVFPNKKASKVAFSAPSS